MVICFVGIGSNLGDREKNIKKAIANLRRVKNIKIEKISRLYQTKPEGYIKQNDFLNGAIRLQTNLEAGELLTRLKKIEKDLGRRKTFRFGPRIIDLDIIIYGNQRIKTKNLAIPHPRMYARDFVLRPLRDVAPELFKHKIIRTVSAMRGFIKSLRAENKTIGFVPTMGYLHEGHLSLVRQAKQDCDKVIVSIFVNPAQFGPNEDLSRYPRDLKKDIKLLKQIGVDAIFYPDVKEVYPAGYLTYVNVEKITEGLCGKHRPRHFRGVATVVTKLFNMVQPDIAYFGQKDFQQARVIEKMSSDLNIPVKIKIMPIVRSTSGLAMSSRNVYLSQKEREDAAVLYRSLRDAAALIKKGERAASVIIRNITKEIKKIKYASVDYVEIVDMKTLEKVNKVDGEVAIALAVWFGKTRLIDNIVINVKVKTKK